MKNDIKNIGKYISYKPVVRKNKTYNRIPPIRTLNLQAQMDLVKDLPESVIELLKSHKPSQAMVEFGVPKKLILSKTDLTDLSLVTSYMITEKNKGSNSYLEILVNTDIQTLWLMSLILKPNNPYFCIFSSEENLPSSSILASYIANYYMNLARSRGMAHSVKWYRSLEFVPYKKPVDSHEVIIIQCRWPSWVDSKEKLFRNILNIRAAFENSTMILIMSENDLDIAPSLLVEEPFSIFVKTCIEGDYIRGTGKRKKKQSIDKIYKNTINKG